MGIQAEQSKLMGQKVTVHHKLVRSVKREEPLTNYGQIRHRTKWQPRECKPFCGWIVGFTHKRNGLITYHTPDDFEEFTTDFRPDGGHVPCVLVRKWINTEPVFVPLDGYTLGGEPTR